MMTDISVLEVIHLISFLFLFSTGKRGALDTDQPLLSSGFVLRVGAQAITKGGKGGDSHGQVEISSVYLLDNGRL